MRHTVIYQKKKEERGKIEATMGRPVPRGESPAKTISSFLIASILYLQMTPSMSATVPRRGPITRLLSRADAEHVVLADCKASNSQFSSQMAYYPGSPQGAPQDVAIVPTTAGQYSLWVDAETSALFTTSGVTFTADLGPKVADGEYAGSGDNGYGSFSCWAKYKKDLYTWNNITCSMVYDCDHRNASDSAASSPSASASATDTSQPGSTRGELSIGAIVGVSIGAGGGAILLAVGIFFLWRHFRNESKNAGLGEGTDNGLSGGSTKGSEAAVVGYGYPVPTGWQNEPPAQEMDSQWRGAEVHSESRKDELDGNPRSELPPPPTPADRLHSLGYDPGEMPQGSR